MNALFKIIFTSILFIYSLNAQDIVINDIQERKFTKLALSHIIKATSKTVDLKLLRKINFFNRKNIIANSIYYQNGTFYKKNIKIDFEKAYFYEGIFYMQNCYGKYQDGFIKSKTASYYNNQIEFQNLILKKEKKLYHKFKYAIAVE